MPNEKWYSKHEPDIIGIAVVVGICMCIGICLGMRIGFGAGTDIGFLIGIGAEPES